MKWPALFVALILMAAPAALAQDPTTGFPPYGSFANGRFGAVNLQNLNMNFAIPIASSPGRGLDLKLALVYDSLIWKNYLGAWTPVGDSSGVALWGWKKTSLTGSINYTTAHWTCVRDNGTHFTVTEYSGYIYVDAAGTEHTFSIDFTMPDCLGGTYTAYANDGSGYYMDASSGTSPVVWSPVGVKITSDGTLTDPNGNFLSKVVVSSTEADWKDTLGRTALKINTPSATSIQYQFLDPTGNYQTTTLNLLLFNVKTAFACSGVVEYNSSAYLPTSLVLPNTQSYQFSYEATPGSAGYVTGRLQRVTLPTGGYYEYDYTGANGSINCADGTTTGLNQVINDGTTSVTRNYARSSVSGKAGTTTVTAPQLPYDAAGNQTVITFDSNGHETSRKIYQRSASTGTLLKTVNTTWNGTPTSQVTILADTNQQSESDTSFDSYENLLQLTEKDWGSGAPGAVIRTTTYTYLGDIAYTARNIVNRPTRVTIADGTGTVKYRKDISYDGASLTSCPIGVPQHDDTNYGCTFTARGNPTSVTTYTNPVTPSGGVTKNFSYDVFGNLVQAAVNCCQQKQWNYSTTTQYAYPDSVVSGPSGGPQLTTSFVYNSSTGLVSSTTDENSQTTSFAYDSLKRPTTVTRPDSAQIAYAYNDAQRTVTVSVPIQSGSATTMQQINSYDGLGRPVSTATADSSGPTYSIVATQYDAVGRAYKVSNPYTATAQYWSTTQFDALGRPTKTILADSNQATYSYSGTTVTVTDPAGKQRKSQTDASGRLVSVFEPDVTNSNSLTQQTSYAYTVLDALASVSQGVQARTYSYDGMGRLTSVATPEASNASYQYQYNSFDLVTQRTDPRGVITNYSYDTLNRLTQISYNIGTTGVPATPTVTFSYGTNPLQYNNGRLVKMTDGVGSESYTYSNLGQITQLQKVISGTTYMLGYAYNLAGELTSLTYPSGRVTYQSYDPIGRLCEVAGSAITSACGATSSPYASGFGYNTAQQPTGFSYGNGVTASFGYSPDRLELTSLSYTKGTQTLFSSNYWYKQDATNCAGGSAGNNGQIQCITDAVDSGRSVSYSYDALARLSTAVTQGSTAYPKWGLSWTYDRFGNRTAQTVTAGTSVPSNSVAVSAATNRLTDPGYGYDADGNMTNDGANSLAYDAESRLVSSSSSSYSYDGNGLRVQKASTGTTTLYIFSRGQVIAEYVNGAVPGSPTREYVYLGNKLLAKIEAGAMQYYQGDHLSVRAITDANGNLIGQQGHYPFGEQWYAASTATKWQFTGYERDAESGNDYAMFRYDVNRLGRFSSPDLLAGTTSNPQTLNRYAYVANSPTNLTDPTGLLIYYGNGDAVLLPAGSSWDVFDLFFVFDPREGRWFIDHFAAAIFSHLLDPPIGPGGGPPRIEKAQSENNQGLALTKFERIAQECDKIRAAGGGQVKVGAEVFSFNSAGQLTAFSVPLGGDSNRFVSAQLVGRDPFGNASVVFSFSKPYLQSGVSLDSVLFQESLSGGNRFTAATGTILGVDGRLAETFILHELNSNDLALGLAGLASSHLGDPCEGVLLFAPLLGGLF